MTFINTIKKSFSSVIKNPSITLFLIAYLIVTNLLIVAIAGAKAKVFAISFLVCLILLSGAFFAGWMQVIKEVACEIEEKDKNFGAIFLEGVGKNILPVAIGVVVLIVAMNLVIMLVRFLAIKVFGDIQPIIAGLSTVAQDTKSVSDYITNLGQDKVYSIYGWALSGIVALTLFAFSFMYYFPSIINEEKYNLFLKPFVAIPKCLYYLFKNFLTSFLAFILIYLGYLFFVILNALYAQQMILSVIVLFGYIYFVSFAIMLIFNCYEEKNCCPNGSDCVGENESVDKSSEEA